MIEAISVHIAKKMSYAVSKSVVFSISFDISRKDQLSFVVRYVDETTGCVHERFLENFYEKYTFNKWAKFNGCI